MIAKKYRVPREKIAYILKKGDSFKSQLFIVRLKPNQETHNRFRTIVSLKIDKKAVKRNKLRRQIYEALRLSEQENKQEQNYDLIIIPKKSILGAKYQDIEKDLKNLILKQPFLKNING